MEEYKKVIDLKGFFTILKRYLLFITLFTLIFTLLSWYISSFLITPIYEASTEILVNKFEDDQDNAYNLNDMNTDLKLISTYSVIIKSPRITDLVIAEYGLDLTSEELVDKLSIETVTDSQVMKISVKDTDYIEAARIANAIVAVFQREIVKIMNVDNVQILSSAKPIMNLKPVSPNVTFITVLALFLSFAIAIGLVLIMEFLDDSLKTDEEIEQLTGYPVLGGISKIKFSKKEKVNLLRQLIDDELRIERLLKTKNNMPSLITFLSTKSPISEAFRTLRNNIQFASIDKPIKTIMFTSANPNEGKSTIVSNLAIVLAQINKKVLLIDTDLVNPTIHKLFYLNNAIGVTNLLINIELMEEAIQVTKIPNLSVLTSGVSPANPTELLNSEKMENIIQLLSKEYDYILFDAPPIISDSQILSQYVEGVVIVVSIGKTKLKNVLRAKGLLEKAKANVIGTVVNNQNYKDSNDLYYYYGKH